MSHNGPLDAGSEAGMTRGGVMTKGEVIITTKRFLLLNSYFLLILQRIRSRANSLLRQDFGGQVRNLYFSLNAFAPADISAISAVIFSCRALL